MKKIQYTLDTIHCSGCTYKIEDRLLKQNGICSCSLNFINLKLTIIYDESIISGDELTKKVKKAIDSSNITQVRELQISEAEIKESNNSSLKLRKRMFFGR